MSRRQYPLPERGSQPSSDTGCHILHVDMDAFYAQASLLAHPELVGTPVIIGGRSGRSVVLSATYEAREFGVTSAMPMGRASRLCPQATVLSPQPDLYARISSNIMRLFRTISPQVEPLGIDEAFIDVTGALRRLGTPAQIARSIKDQVMDEQGLTCTVGVASTKFVAKIASTHGKPDGLIVVPATEVITFIQALPVGALWGVGERTEEQLHRLGLRQVYDIAHTPLETLTRALGAATGTKLHELSWGRDPRRVQINRPEHSLSSDSTFAHDVDDPQIQHAALLALSERTAARARAARQVGRTVTIKVRFADFTTITRSRTLSQPTDISQEIYGCARELFDALGLQRARVRLLGVALSQLRPSQDTARQMMLDERARGWPDADRAADAARARFGSDSIRPASLLGDWRES